MNHLALFEPRRVLHIHALYVCEVYRNRGIGQALLQALLEWGQRSACVEAELNTLWRNPARSLYERLGFRELEIRMTRRL